MIKILDFYADWCMPCKKLAPILEELEAEEWLSIDKIDIEDDVDNFTEKFGVKSIPTLLIFKDEKLVTKIVGFSSKERILASLNNLK